MAEIKAGPDYGRISFWIGLIGLAVLFLVPILVDRVNFSTRAYESLPGESYSIKQLFLVPAMIALAMSGLATGINGLVRRRSYFNSITGIVINGSLLLLLLLTYHIVFVSYIW